ncbi:GNAT family N-acetyltransferase [Paenibacillus lycopersici]|uniref:GNAT family N-acetyltransferase n=1 Tax=Paenibacillus lycopersici TaxID=2704462 RepID=A0A6C0G648_9BACL|nr:GNAT family N-acetyltransferase [Paenibacillus lycopersici]QHT62760.1 GNAT family N-acetyltransferase [Paenibacillus lycopersici]
MTIDIRPIRAEDYAAAHAFQCEYLDRESYEEFEARAKANPDLYLAAFAGGELIGIVYGHPSRREAGAAALQGIAVTLDETKRLARTGIGSRLIASFEEAVRRRGLREISLGAADDLKVELFYVKNGYLTNELVAMNADYEQLERAPIADYASGKERQEQLRSKHQAHQVIFIFGKIVG